MITREINEVARELTNMVIDSIFRIAKERQEDEVDLDFQFHNELYTTMSVYFPSDDEEFDSTEDYLDEMDIEVESEYTDEDGQVYTDTTSIQSLDLSVLLQIYNTIKD